MDFRLTVGGLDFGFTNVVRSGAPAPDVSLVDLRVPTDKTAPWNGVTSDPEDSPRIAADGNSDGTYERLALPTDQIQLNVNGYCVGFPCNDGNDCTVDQCDPRNHARCTYTNEPDDTQCMAASGTGMCVAGLCGSTVFPCTEQGLRDAIAVGGGPHRFDCTAPTTVTMHSDLVIDHGVILQGEGNLTIDGNGSAQILITAGTTVTLGGLVVTNSQGIENNGTLTIENSALTHNNVGSANGGAIYNSETGTLTVDRSVLSGNTAGLAGGGIANRGTATILNSTISSNTAGSGGGIANSVLAVGTVTVINSTIANNNAPQGSAIYNNGPMALTNTLVQGACEGVVTSNGYNIESPGDTCGLVTLTDLVGVTAPEVGLGPLSDNGGPTETHALLPGSVAADRIPEAVCVDAVGQPLTTDQRGVARPQKGFCDVGAFEDDSFPCTEQGIRDAIAQGGAHTFQCEGPTTVATAAEIVIDNDVILDGEGNLTVQGSQDPTGYHRVFSIPTGVTVELVGMTITGGGLQKLLGEHGAGIRTAGTLTLRNTSVVGNMQFGHCGCGDPADDVQGGGIYNTGTRVDVRNSTVREIFSDQRWWDLQHWCRYAGQTAPSPESSPAWSSGKGIYSTGTLVVSRSVVSDNVGPADGADGGGIYSSGDLTVLDSKIRKQ